MATPTDILQNTETTGTPFRLDGGPYVAVMSGHAGGVWTLQFESPDETLTDRWTDLETTFAANGAQYCSFHAAWRYRITGGTVGAEGVGHAVLRHD